LKPGSFKLYGSAGFKVYCPHRVVRPAVVHHDLPGFVDGGLAVPDAEEEEEEEEEERE
jgi:hypothetical protein